MTREPDEWSKLTFQKNRPHLPPAHIAIPGSILEEAKTHSKLKDLSFKKEPWMARKTAVKSDRNSVKVLLELKPLSMLKEHEVPRHLLEEWQTHQEAKS